STRLPGKPLSEIHGKPMIQRVHERVALARRVDRVIVATDDHRIAEAVRAFGGEAVMTSPEHASGTDRLAEVVRGIPEAEIVVNVQGDEPLLEPESIDAAVLALLADPDLPLATLSLPLTSADEMASPSVVKVVTDAAGDALYFSRSPIPFVRGGAGDAATAASLAVARGLARKHVGLYVYRRKALLRFASLPPAPLELAEGLEQLRALHHGLRIRVVPREGEATVAVDTPEDLARVREIFAGETDR
ncbi:MAG TPA: 3-deoxy-manno-octulosonate cytidylyltransferase, partial [Vicinamibacteria bacterium]|nr:3-deoxy-manno-octulosonate cytidylyltransferase [Vicinamibacteria bacterium]